MSEDQEPDLSPSATLLTWSMRAESEVIRASSLGLWGIPGSVPPSTILVMILSSLTWTQSAKPSEGPVLLTLYLFTYSTVRYWVRAGAGAAGVKRNFRSDPPCRTPPPDSSP